MSVRVLGKEQLQSKLNRMPVETKRRVFDALEKSADELVDRARALAPVDDGDLKASIRKTSAGGLTPLFSSGGQRQAGEFQVIVSAGNSKVRYPGHVEYGHSGGVASPRPFFWPSWRMVRRRIKSRIARAIREAVRSIT